MLFRYEYLKNNNTRFICMSMIPLVNLTIYFPSQMMFLKVKHACKVWFPYYHWRSFTIVGIASNCSVIQMVIFIQIQFSHPYKRNEVHTKNLFLFDKSILYSLSQGIQKNRKYKVTTTVTNEEF